MGNGPKPKKNKPVKKPAERRVVATTGEGGVAPGTIAADACVIRFRAQLVMAVAPGQIHVGDGFMLVPSASKDDMDVWLGSSKVGVYRDVNAALMWVCGNAGYQYAGKIEEIVTTPGGALVTGSVQAETHET